MILSEKYGKTVLEGNVYDTVMLADVIELNKEKYLITSGYLFNKRKEKTDGNNIDLQYYENTFFRRNKEENSDIDAYYLIYNMDRKSDIKNKKEFIEKNCLNEILRLDKTKCEEIEIFQNDAYKIKTNKEEYIFVEMNDDETPYCLIKDSEEGLIIDSIIKYNEERNKVTIVNEYEKVQEEAERFEKKNILKTAKDMVNTIKKITINNKKIEEEF